MPRIPAEPPKDPRKKKAAEVEEKYVNQSAELKGQPNDRGDKTDRAAPPIKIADK